MDRAIQKVMITEEARFDYESLYSRPLPSAEIKRETEIYIENQIDARRLYGRYFRAKYLDEATDRMLMIFVYQGRAFGRMQIWEIRGICEADDWSEELEESGQIRAWLNSTIDPEDDGDWVEDLRIREERERKEREDYNDD